MCSQYFEIYCGSKNVNLAKIFCFAQKDNIIVAIHVVHTCTSAKWIMDGMAVQHYYCWFAADVMAAMLDYKNKIVSLPWELNSFFMQIL